MVTSKWINVDFSFFAAPGMQAIKGTTAQLRSRQRTMPGVRSGGLTENDADNVPMFFTRNLDHQQPWLEHDLQGQHQHESHASRA
jgi:hypothetical protein